MLKKVNQKGFTIIEVLIVLAIAGVIMLVVFLAVPALQRNSRNTQRSNDASLIAAGVNECLTNKNGQVSSCNAFDTADPPTATDKLNTTLDIKKIRQLSDITVVTAYNSGGAPAVTTNTSAVIMYGAKCGADGASFSQGTSRQFVVLYNVEPATGSNNVPRCIDS